MSDMLELPQSFERQTILALNQFGQVVTSSLKLDDVLARIMEQVTALLNSEGVAIIMPEGDDQLRFVAVCGIGAAQLKDTTMPNDTGVAGYVMQTGEPVWLNSDGCNVPGLGIYRQIETVSEFHSQSLLASPLIQGGVTIGVLEAAHSLPDALTVDDLTVLCAAAHWAAIAISNAQLHEQAQHLREQQAALEERARLARELHDAVTQSLYSMAVLAGAWRRQIEAGNLAPQRDHIAELGDLAQNALREVRLLIYELRPTELEEEGLIGALYRRLETVEQRSGIQARLIVMDEAGRPYQLPADGREAMVDFYRLPPPLELALYRIAQEALNNVLKHSKATTVTMRIRLGADTISIEIEDNGRGFDADDRPQKVGGFGMLGLKERVKQLGGYFSIVSAPATGTTIRVTDIPYRLAEAEEMVKL
jgi:signal transduction histidine kinase